jgi:hypothetical protein
MSPVADNVICRLDAARQKWWFFSLLCTIALAVCVSAGLLLGFLVLDAHFRFSQGVLGGLLAIWLAVTGYAMWVVARRLARHNRTLEATARRVESEFPEIGSHLINLVQLSEDGGHSDSPFRDAAVKEAAQQSGGVAFSAAANRQSRWRRLHDCMQTPRDLAEVFVLLAIVVTAIIYCRATIPNLGSAANRLLAPWNFVPSIGRTGKIDVKPGDAEVVLGGNLTVTATLADGAAHAGDARLFIQPESEAETSVPMNAVGQVSNLSDKSPTGKAAGQVGNLSYEAAIPSILKAVRYRVEIGDSQSEAYRITVSEKPMVAEVAVTYEFPKYIGRKDETVTLKTPDLDAPQYTVAVLQIRPTIPVTKGHVELVGRKYPGDVQEVGKTVEVKIPLLENGSYTIHLFVRDKLTDDAPRVNRIQVVPDRPPTVELLKPVRGATAAPGGEIPVMVRANDDYGVGQMTLEMKTRAEGFIPSAETGETSAPESRQDNPAGSLTVKTWTDFKNEAAPVRQHRLGLKSDEIQPGSTVLLRAVASDERSLDGWGQSLKPQEAATPWLEIKIIGAEENDSAALADLESLRNAVWRILEKQIHARVAASGIAKTGQAVESARVAGDVRTQQIDVQKSTAEIVKSLGPSENKERQTIKQVLGSLAANKMLAAVKESDDLAKRRARDLREGEAPAEPRESQDGPPSAARQEPRPPDVVALASTLLATQDHIIATLRKVLESSRLAEEKMLAEMEKRPGGNLPDDVRQKLEAARDKLNEFLKAQKKVIEASENLAKTPVEDFSEEQEQALRKMAAAEADWAKFMNELKTDLSKLPEQDFANASALKEAVEVQVELKMAEDALTKKSVDIAVPLEQLGYERAEELVTNFEKWLPDTPDREKWSQEESLTDKDKEAPMAELPGELEDMIGDLMEQEEDLFDEMEDVTSSAADSLDKGAGWDATDGPISNMSAKGVTGNRLPNTSEIGGRSGEGRQGKSSGEFVGDEAVGKGGRKTPSRLTPDPIVKGQIKDHSKDSAGGATGGGKESGQGGEGLEGPLPRSPGKRDLERLAGKQAVLRNTAESVDLQFQILNFHQTDLKKLIETMSQVELDLKAGRYQNALRQRPVLLEKMTSVKQYLDGEFQVRQDTTSNLPADIQNEILNSMQDPSPAGWEELNRQYFERLSSDGNGNEQK